MGPAFAAFWPATMACLTQRMPLSGRLLEPPKQRAVVVEPRKARVRLTRLKVFIVRVIEEVLMLWEDKATEER